MATQFLTVIMGVFGLTLAMNINHANKPSNFRELEKFLRFYQQQKDYGRMSGRSHGAPPNVLAEDLPAIEDYVEILNLCGNVVDHFGLLDSIFKSHSFPADRYSTEKLSLEVCKVAVVLYQIIDNEDDNSSFNQLEYLAGQADKRSFDSIAAGPLKLGKRPFDRVGDGPLDLGRRR